MSESANRAQFAGNVSLVGELCGVLDMLPADPDQPGHLLGGSRRVPTLQRLPHISRLHWNSHSQDHLWYVGQRSPRGAYMYYLNYPPNAYLNETLKLNETLADEAQLFRPLLSDCIPPLMKVTTYMLMNCPINCYLSTGVSALVPTAHCTLQ